MVLFCNELSIILDVIVTVMTVSCMIFGLWCAILRKLAVSLQKSNWCVFLPSNVDQKLHPGKCSGSSTSYKYETTSNNVVKTNL